MYNTDKINRFTEALAKYAVPDSMIKFWNECLDEIEGNEAYVSELEMVELKHAKRMEFFAQNAKTIAMANRTLKQLKHLRDAKTPGAATEQPKSIEWL